MSAFKDALAGDVGLVFLNEDEFGETVEIDGVEVTAVRCDAAKEAASATSFAPDWQPSLPSRDVVLWVRTDDIASDLEQGGSCTVGGVLHTVLARHDGLGGMTRLELYRNGYLS